MEKTIQLDLINDTEPYICENCGNQTFIQVFYVRKLSALYSPTGQEEKITIPVLKCEKCGHINKEYQEIANKLEEKKNELNEKAKIIELIDYKENNTNKNEEL